MTGALLGQALRLTVWMVLLALLFAPLEHLFALRRRPSPRAVAADLGYFYLNGLVPALLLAPPLALLAGLARMAAPAPWTADLPVAARLALGLVVAEAGSYWAHRWCHALPLLWRFHVVHHQIEHLDWLANTRAHPLDVVFTRLCGLAPLYALGLAGTGGASAGLVPALVTVVGTAWSFFIHANVRWRFGWLEHLVATPAFHHWHHTNGRDGRDRNFSALFPWMDRLFGTLHLPRCAWPPCYGVDAPVAGGMEAELLVPFGARRRGTGLQGQVAEPRPPVADQPAAPVAG